MLEQTTNVFSIVEAEAVETFDVYKSYYHHEGICGTEILPIPLLVH